MLAGLIVAVDIITCLYSSKLLKVAMSFGTCCTFSNRSESPNVNKNEAPPSMRKKLTKKQISSEAPV